MHIVIAIITTLATLIYVMDRFGIDVGGLNPWAWSRRRRWRKQLAVNPAFNLKTPMEAMALLLLATARIDGDVSSQEKNELRQIFMDSFKQNSRDASSLLSSSTYLLGAGDEVFKRPQEVLAPSLEEFRQEQREDSMGLLERISEVGGPASDVQIAFIGSIRAAMFTETETKGWQ